MQPFKRPAKTERQTQLAILKRELAALPENSPLWAALVTLLDSFIITETQASVTPGVDDTELRRFQGRIGMLIDLRAELEVLPAQARAEATK